LHLTWRNRTMGSSVVCSFSIYGRGGAGGRDCWHTHRHAQISSSLWCHTALRICAFTLCAHPSPLFFPLFCCSRIVTAGLPWMAALCCGFRCCCITSRTCHFADDSAVVHYSLDLDGFTFALRWTSTAFSGGVIRVSLISPVMARCVLLHIVSAYSFSAVPRPVFVYDCMLCNAGIIIELTICRGRATGYIVGTWGITFILLLRVPTGRPLFRLRSMKTLLYLPYIHYRRRYCANVVPCPLWVIT